jgi:hypothetical protein
MHPTRGSHLDFISDEDLLSVNMDRLQKMLPNTDGLEGESHLIQQLEHLSYELQN